MKVNLRSKKSMNAVHGWGQTGVVVVGFRHTQIQILCLHFH